MEKDSERNYYINTCIKQNLSVRQLLQKIKDKEYERLEYKENIELITEEKEITVKEMIKSPIIIKVDKDIDKLNEKRLYERYYWNDIV